MHHVQHMLNFWAILVSAIVLWILGAFWFSPALFAKPWVAAMGRQMDEKPHKPPVHGMVSSFICDLLIALVLTHFVVWSGAPGFGWGAFVGFITWLGFIAAVLYPQRIYEGRSFTYFFIVAGYWFVGLIIIGGILAAWR